jgi:hypothetical protein
LVRLSLLSTTVQSYLQAPPNFYALLSVSPSVDEPTLKSAFRIYAKVNHPDRVGVQGEQKFIEARDAFDVLKSGIRRWAYDRFGPEVIGWEKECTSVGDYLERGLMASCGFYIVTAIVMVLYAIFGQSGFGAFVSLLCAMDSKLTIFIVEIQPILQPYRPRTLAHPLSSIQVTTDNIPWSSSISAHQISTSIVHLFIHCDHSYWTNYPSILLRVDYLSSRMGKGTYGIVYGRSTDQRRSS